MGNITSYKSIWCNSGWDSGGWATNKLDGGYAYNPGTNKAYVIELTTPKLSSGYDGVATSTLTIKIPYVNIAKGKTGTFYVKCYTKKPTDSSKYSDYEASASKHDASVEWTASASYSGWNSVSCTIENLDAGKTYYIALGATRDDKSTTFEIGNGTDSIKPDFNFTHTGYNNVSNGSITITDNYNNTFTINAKPGSGENNTVKSHKVLWGYSSDYDSNTGTGNGLKSLTVSGTNLTRAVYVKSITDATYGPNGVATKSASIRQYSNPNPPGKPKISYTKKKLTIREPWTFTWAAATGICSPVVGYRIRIMKDGTALTGLVSSTNNTVVKGNNTNNWIDRDSSSCTITFDPKELGFKAGDKVSVGIYSYSRYGKDNDGKQLFNGGGHTDDQVISDVSLVENAGIMHVKVGNSWKEGQVYVKVGGTWKEAESVHTKVNGSWKESQ